MKFVEVAALVGAAAAAVAGARADAFAPTALGPGKGPWRTASPEAHGLSTKSLDEAAATLEREVPVRQCFLVARDGELVYENYASGDKNTRTEMDSLAKTMMALVVGRAQAVYGADDFHLDKPMHEYGIPENFANWSQGKNKSVSFYPNATLRHVLTQTTGQGYVAPGTAFTYDSDEFIQYGSHVLSTFAKEHGNETAVAFASREFAAKMGLAPDLFDWDGVDGGGVSMGGGQRMTCREALRVGQLMLNVGVLPSSDGFATQFVPKEFMHELRVPNFPRASSTYGFLTWLNAKVPDKDKDEAAHCCKPSWGESCHFSYDVRPGLSIIGDNIEAPTRPAPEDTQVGVGFLGKYLFVIPSTRTVILTVGQTWGSSTLCDIARAPGTNYDDAYTLTAAWNAMSGAFADGANAVGSEASSPPAAVERRRLHSRVAKAQERKEAAKASVGKEVGGGEKGKETLSLRSRPRSRSRARTRGRSQLSVRERRGGSCTCLCPPAQGFGRCFDVSAADVAAADASGADVCASLGVATMQARQTCPAVGIVRQCKGTGAESAADEQRACAAVRLGNFSGWAGGGAFECGPLAAGAGACVAGDDKLRSGRCSCQPTAYAECWFTEGEECDASDPFYKVTKLKL